MFHSRINYINLSNQSRETEIEREVMADAIKKVVLITGCAKGGIGYEYCIAFSALGCHVIASDLPDRLPELSDLHSDSLPLDVSSDTSVTSAISQIIAKHGRIDVLINNAGIGSTGPLAELNLDDIRRTWEVNTLGQLRMVQAVVPHMAAQRSGRIVNIGSVVGTAATPWAGSYCAAKAAAHAMTDVLRVELRPFGVDVIKVVPGTIRSNIVKSHMERSDGQEWRLYGRFKEEIAERARASQTAQATDAGVFARHVARRVMRPKPPREIVYGYMTGLFAVLAWSPLWARDLYFAKRFGLDKKL